jgi:hypothetical protein
MMVIRYEIAGHCNNGPDVSQLVRLDEAATGAIHSSK